MQTQIEVPLSKLKPDPANVRKTDAAPTEQFLASIRAEGILEPLTVRPNGDGYFVTNGGKRLAALCLIVKENKAGDPLVPCIVRQLDEKEARNISLAVNYMREEMHPVDEFEAFVRMQMDGMLPDDIGKKYGLNKREVARVLALGRLAPEVREAWRKGDLEDEEAQVFTLEPDLKRQASILKKVGKHTSPWEIRSEIVGEAHKTAGMLRLVGLEAYKAAGGATTEDLFTDAKTPELIATDTKLLKRLADEKLAATVEKLKTEGWKWVALESELPSGAGWWNGKAKNSVAADDRAKFGVIVRQNHSGDLDIKYGVTKPSEQKAGEKKKAAAKGDIAEVSISAALSGRLSEQITRAAAIVLETDTHLAMASIAAALTCYEGPVCIDRKGAYEDDAHDKDFDKQLALFRKKTPADLAKVLAGLAASALDMGGHVQHALPLAEDRDEDRALLEALDPKKLNAQLRANFDAADYFAGVTRDACIEAIKLCDPKQPLTGKEKKGELAKLAADLVKKSNAGGKAGYLPPEMRTSKYDGPKPAKAAPAKKVAKKKAA